MVDWPVHAEWNGPVVMLGFGSIGRGVLPLILRHIKVDRSRITIIDPSDLNKHMADAEGLTFVQKAVTKDNCRKLLKPLLTAGPGQAFIVNLTVDVGSLDMMALARETGSLYIDTVIEPWPGFYYNAKADNAARTNYALRQGLIALKAKLGVGPTAVSCCGANPGMVSWFVKQALLNVARDLKIKTAEPSTREGWAKLMKRAGIKGIHIAERDTQRAKKPKPAETFINTWSVDGFISEGLQPAELGWGTHEKKLPAGGKQHKTGSKCAIYITHPGGDTRVRSWTPTAKAQHALLVTHNEAISIADYFTVKAGKKAVYRPTCHYAYHPSNDAILSIRDMFGRGGEMPLHKHVLDADEILDGRDELGVLLYGHKKNAYWYGSQLSIDEAKKLAPHQSATGLQVRARCWRG